MMNLTSAEVIETCLSIIVLVGYSIWLWVYKPFSLLKILQQDKEETKK